MRSKTAPSTVAKWRAATASDDFIRDVAGGIAVALAGTAEGRAVGLSIEVWPEHDVSLRVRTGHELRIFLGPVDGILWVRWERVIPGASRDQPTTDHGRLGRLHEVSAEHLRVFMADWLAWRVRG